jgi:superfamily I DNA and/or RNA helicase
VLTNINQESHISICRINKTKESFYEESGLIDYYTSTSKVNFSKNYKIYGGTPWALAHESFNEHLDYLFVDEAGQVSLANLVGISASCKNIILMGDQMQLSQPATGSHPTNAGASSLEYVLEGNATIPKDRGIFLTETYRLHPDICDFISHKIYEDRLHAAPANKKRKLIHKEDSLIKPSGIQYIQLDHEGNEQASPEEVEAIKDIINQLLSSRLFDGNEERAITKKDILIVSPFNHQIRNLQDVLGDEIQIGTVDKFQGREAPIVIFSMASSDIESTPRGANFLFEKNRLNVAITRAQSLAIIVGSKGLEKTDSYNIKDIKDISFYLDMINSN